MKVGPCKEMDPQSFMRGKLKWCRRSSRSIRAPIDFWKPADFYFCLRDRNETDFTLNYFSETSLVFQKKHKKRELLQSVTSIL